LAGLAIEALGGDGADLLAVEAQGDGGCGLGAGFRMVGKVGEGEMTTLVADYFFEGFGDGARVEACFAVGGEEAEGIC